ncbi:uncharacterized protein ccdc71 [Brachionichthys hirsutus]|uniref:uncharacterized protein ccdc71 n=1 Tax=Brachionichthys hirsutus TaxID=412623 RepID=UPI0036043EB8
MANDVHGPVIDRPLMFANEEQRALHSWTRISSAGHNILLDALKILNPMSRDLSTSEELFTFVQDLSEEGHKPTVLCSKDVYGYRSCTSRPLTEEMLKSLNRNVRPTAKRRGKKPLTRKREVHPSWNISEKSSPRIQGIRPPELQVDKCTLSCRRTPGRTVEVSEVLQLRPCLKLTNIKGLSGFPTARLQIHTSLETSSVNISQQQVPPVLSGIPLQPSQNVCGAPTKAVALFSQKSLSCPLRLDGALIGDSAPVFYANKGRTFSETCTELTSNGWRSYGFQQDDQDPKELNTIRPRNGWKDKNSLRWRVIKVDDSRSVEEARRKAQKALQVNLSPVIQIQPLNHLLRDLR